MSSAPRAKNSDKQGLCKKLVTLLKKHYKGTPTSAERPVLDTMLYAVCLENTTAEDAETTIERLLSSFHDLNEVRVSSVTELTAIFEGMDDGHWRALQVRGVLQYIFEKEFVFDFESLRKKTLELATKSIGKIRDLSTFARSFTLQEALGSHLVPLDAAQTNAAIWLGLADVGSTEEQASAALRPVLRKGEAHQFCDLLRPFAVEPDIRALIAEEIASPPEDGFDVETSPARVTDIMERAVKRKASAKHSAKAAAKSPAGKTKPPAAKPPAAKAAPPKAASAKPPAAKAAGAKASGAKLHQEDGEPSSKSRPKSAKSGGGKDAPPRSGRPPSRSHPGK